MTKRTGAGQLEREKNKRKVEEYLGRSQIEFESRILFEHFRRRTFIEILSIQPKISSMVI